MSGAYYNEFEPYAAEWLRNLIKAGHIADGEVDGRSIVDVGPDDLRGFTQCHFFAGIGGWSYAARLAGWPDDRPLWTGSCPCQPFSAAGKGKGFEDERHLWPEFHRLIRQCAPPVVFGEQVASKDGLAWLDTVHASMEASGYAFGAADICAAGLGAPHIRQRLWFVGERLADASFQGLAVGSIADVGRGTVRHQRSAVAQDELPRGLADAEHDDGRANEPGRGSQGRTADGRCGADGRLADADGRDAGAEGLQRGGQQRQQPEDGGTLHGGRPGPTNGFWRAADWLYCRDGRWRPVEPGTLPLAHGAPARVGRLRAYGNAINPYPAAEVIAAFMECRP